MFPHSHTSEGAKPCLIRTSLGHTLPHRVAFTWLAAPGSPRAAITTPSSGITSYSQHSEHMIRRFDSRCERHLQVCCQTTNRMETQGQVISLSTQLCICQHDHNIPGLLEKYPNPPFFYTLVDFKEMRLHESTLNLQTHA